jgi:uncharacterized protein (TIGR02246 family)
MKNQRFTFHLLFLMAIFGLGCSQQAPQEQDDLAAINALYNKYVHAAETGDLDAFMTCWEEGGMRAEPGLPTIIGKDNIRARFAELFAAPVDNKITPLGEPILEIYGDIAVSYRTVTLASTPHDGSEPLVQDMNVLSIIKRQEDGSWLTYIDCINFHPTWSLDTIPGALRQDNPYY